MISGAVIVHLEMTCSEDKSPILTGLARWAQNIGRFSINLGGSCQGGYRSIRGSGLVYTDLGGFTESKVYQNSRYVDYSSARDLEFM